MKVIFHFTLKSNGILLSLFDIVNVMHMDEIKEIVQFLSMKKIRRIETLNMDDEGDSIYRDFYYLILNEPNITEEELARRLARTNAQSKKYGMIKNRFKKKLFNHALFLDLSENLTKQTIEISKAYRNIYLATLFMNNNLRKSAYYINNKNLKVIEKYELIDLLIKAYQIKLSQSSIDNQPKKLEEYANKLIFYSKAFNVYTKSLIIYEKAGLLYSKYEILKSSDLKKLNQLIEETKNVLNDEGITFNTKWMLYSVLLEYYEYIGNYTLLLKDVDKVEKMLSKNPIFFYKTRKVLLYTWKLSALGNLKINNGNSKLINLLQELYEKNTMGWFLIQRKLLLFYVNTEEYNLAINITEETIESLKFQSLQAKLQEMWLLWHTYLLMLDANYHKEKLAEIKLAKVLNSVPQISKDKLGLNTLVRTLEIVYRYLIYDDENLVEIYNALLIYKSRYLKPNKLRRAQIFFDMVTATSKRGYTNEITKREGEKAFKRYERLKNDNPERKAYEFIPYEKLIKVMMGRP